MNIAIIFAGGTGQRMNTTSKPKQFLELHGKPIIVYTIEHFQNHPLIDGIVVVCIESWIEYCKSLIGKYSLTKVKNIVPGGNLGQESIFNGLLTAETYFPHDSIVLVHDGVRPLIDEKIITLNIESVKKYGSAVTVSPAIETIVLNKKEGVVGDIIDRSCCQLAKAPQSFYLKDIISAHKSAVRENRFNFIDSASLMKFYGFELFTVVGPSENIKITTPSDFYVFRAIIDARENLQIIGL